MGYCTWIHPASMLGFSVVYLVPISFQRFTMQTALRDTGLMPLFLRFLSFIFFRISCPRFNGKCLSVVHAVTALTGRGRSCERVYHPYHLFQYFPRSVSMYIDRFSPIVLMNCQCLPVSYDVQEIYTTDLLSSSPIAAVTNTTNNTIQNLSIVLQELAITQYKWRHQILQYIR